MYDYCTWYYCHHSHYCLLLLASPSAVRHGSLMSIITIISIRNGMVKIMFMINDNSIIIIISISSSSGGSSRAARRRGTARRGAGPARRSPGRGGGGPM